MTTNNAPEDWSEDLSARGYERKTSEYFASERRDFLELLPQSGAGRVLEIGCGTGDTGAAAIAEGRCESYHGFELAPQAASVARSRLTEVIEGNVEQMDLPWPDQHFDAVLMLSLIHI